MHHLVKYSLVILVGVLLLLHVAPVWADDIATNDTCYTGRNHTGALSDGVIAMSLAAKENAINAGKSISAPSVAAAFTQRDNARRVIKGFSIPDVTVPPPAAGGVATMVPDCEPANVISFCYDPDSDPNSVPDSNKPDCTGSNVHTVTLAQAVTGSQHILHGDLFQVVRISDKLCVQYNSGGTSAWVTMGCRMLVPPEPMEALVNMCYVGSSCYHDANRLSRNFFPLTSVIVQCFQESLHMIFQDVSQCPGRTNIFVMFKNNLRKAVTAALVLYVIFFGIKVVLGQEVPEKGEIFMFLIKMILVMYFALGDGIQNDLYPAFIGAAQSLAQIMFASGGAPGLCVYHPADYPAGHSDMALWDALDCRILYYLGVYNSATISKLMMAGGTALVALFTLPIFAMLIPLILAFQLLPLIFMIIFTVFLVSVTLYVVHTYIIAIISMTLLLLFAPLLIPMALFKETKGFYEGWLRMMISFTLQPMALFSFLGIMMGVMDRIYYKGCGFTTMNSASSGWPLFQLSTSAGNAVSGVVDANVCKESFGYKMDAIAQMIDSGSAGGTINAILFSFQILLPIGTGADMFQGLAVLCMFLYFFYYMAGMLGYLVGDLTGGSMVSAATLNSPMNQVDKAKGKVADKITEKLGAASRKNEGKGASRKGGSVPKETGG